LGSEVKTTIKGLESLIKSYQERSDRALKINAETMSTIVSLVEGNAEKLIRNKTSKGKATRYNPKRTVTVSAEGKAPNSDLGDLIKGIVHDVKKTKRGLVIGTIRSKAPYSFDLEYGTEKMAKRPFMRPALKGSRKQILKIIAEGLKRAL